MKQLKYMDGDVIDALKNGDVDVIMHCCNNKGVMGAGIAKQIKEQIPEAFEIYIEDGYTLGAFSMAGGVINLVAQDGYGSDGKRYVHYGALGASLSAVMLFLTDVHSQINAEKITIGVPYKMACDRAGGDWEVVEELIEGIFESEIFDVHVYKFNG